jgi:TP901 family phage tail tape measure protein
MPIQLGSAAGKIILDASGAMSSISQVQGGMGGLRGTFASTSAALTSVGRSLTFGVSLPLIGVGAAAAKTAGDFEGQMNVLQVAARSSGTALGELREAAIAVGADTELVGISASEAADAMTNFYKAGLTTNDIFDDLNGYLDGTTSLNGALRAAVDLAAASELDLAGASDVVAIAMATFGLSAKDATRIADSFVASADASVASVPELADALANVGPTAAAFGWSLETTNTALAILSERGIRGSEAGTALKSMMTNLMRPTDDVTNTLKDLNVSLYNADGTMRDLPEIMGDLERGLAGMTEEQRNQAIQTLAGTYGMKAMNTLLADGSAGWNEMVAQIAAGATAQETAAARTKGFNAALEQLQGSAETLLIRVGTPLIENFLTPAIGKITELANVISGQLDPKTAGMAVTFGLVAIAAGPVLTVLGALISPIGLIAGGIAALGVAWATNFGGIRDAVANIWASTLEPILGVSLPEAIDRVRNTIYTLVEAFKVGGLPGVGQVLATMLGTTPEELVARATSVFNQVLAAFNDFKTTFTGIKAAVWGKSLSEMVSGSISVMTIFGPDRGAAIIQAVAMIRRTIDSLVSGVQGFVANLAPIRSSFQELTADVQQAAPGLGILAAVIGGVLLGALQAVGAILPGLGSAVADIIGTAMGLVGNLLVVIGSAVEMLYKFFTGDMEGAREAAREMVRGVGEIFTTILGGALQLVADLLSVVSGLLTALGGDAAIVGEAIAGLAELIHGLGEAFSNIHLPDLSGFKEQLANLKVPDWLKPGSPTPLEMGLRGISAAMKEAAAISAGMMAPTLTPAAAPAGGAGYRSDNLSYQSSSGSGGGSQIIQLVVDGQVLARVVSGRQGQQANQLRKMGGPGRI